MRQIFTIFILFCSTLLWGQKTLSTDITSATKSHCSKLFFIDSMKGFEVAGIYITSNGFTGYRLALNCSGTFLKTGFDCVSRSQIDSGFWQLKDGNKLLLTSVNTTISYYFFKVDNFYFIVPEHQKQKFIKDYHATEVELKNAKPFTIDSKIYSPEYLIGFSLMKKYFAKELVDLTSQRRLPY